MVKYTHKTLAGQGNGLYRDPENYLTSLGFTKKSAFDSPTLVFVRREGDFVISVSDTKPVDYPTKLKVRYIGFEGDHDSVNRFIAGLEGLILPLDAVLN
nr:hypothetical protein [Nanoarchaeum sp.]